MIVIDDSNAQDFLDHISQMGFSRGLRARDYSANPSGCHAGVATFPEQLYIANSDQSSWLAEQQRAGTSLYELRNRYYDFLKSYDQDGYGLCWAFSSTKGNAYQRIKAGLPPLVLSAWFVAGKVKGWRDEGGWGSESASFLAQSGAPEYSKCPEYRSSYDNADTEANAALHKITTWYDGTDSRDTNVQVMIAAFLRGYTPILDYNWLSHSMCGCRLVSINPLVVDCDNSWSETSQYGERGLYRLSGNRAVPDGVAVCCASEPSLQ